jgi:two-component system nitrate/nitrite response regulator NarL
MEEKTIHTVLIIDDHPLLRRSIRQLLEMDDTLEAVGDASNAEDGIRLAVELEPDLILLDLNMPHINGIETIKMLRDAEVYARVIVFTVSDHEEDVTNALKAGADGYLLKDMEPEDILEKIAQAAAGKMVISEKLTEVLAIALKGDTRVAKVDFSVLTPRERQIVKLITAGMSNKVIGRRLSISDGTVKVHVKHMLKKLNLRSRLEVAVMAAEKGLR